MKNSITFLGRTLKHSERGAYTYSGALITEEEVRRAVANAEMQWQDPSDPTCGNEEDDERLIYVLVPEIVFEQEADGGVAEVAISMESRTIYVV
jgi:hypothetical protein